MDSASTDDLYYGPDLSLIHDLGYGQIAEKAALTVRELFSNTNPAEVTVIDLGCGTGILAAALSRLHYKVTGVDYSDDMLAIARKKAPEAAFIRSSLFDYTPPPCDAVCSTGESISYLFDDDHDVKAVRRLFGKVFHALKPGGYFIFDFLTPDIWETNDEKIKLIEAGQWTIVISISAEDNTRILRREMIIFLKEGDHYKKSREVHRQRLYKPGDLKNILEGLGFSVKATDRYGDLVFRRGHTAFICRKNGL